MMIRIKLIALFSTLLLFIAGCGTAANDGKEEEPGNTNGGGIVAGEMVQSIREIGDYQFNLTIQNNTEQIQTLTFSSSQDYDYQIKDSSGEVLYTYSADKTFLQAIEEEILKQGERLEFQIDATEALTYLEKGDYILEAWVTANDVSDKVTIEFLYE